MNAPADQLYLHSYLAPLADLLAREDVTDIYVNRPGEVWTESIAGGIERVAVPALTAITLERLARQIAAFASQGINREHPLLSATLPDGTRVQVVAPPASRDGTHVFAFRRHVVQDLTLADYVDAGAFGATRHGRIGERSDGDRELSRLLDAGEIGKLLAMAVRGRRNVLISGGTSTGKTTFLGALLREVPTEERLILIEDTPELQLRHENAVAMVAARGVLGEAQVTTDDLLTAALRMRPDRIIVGEIRGPEAYTFLRAINTGHAGSLTTIHADSAERAIDQLALLVLQGGARLAWDDIQRYVRETVDVFVQLSRIGGRRLVSEVVLRST